MNRIAPEALSRFQRAYRFTGGRLRGIRILAGSERSVTVEFRLVVREALKDLGNEPRLVKLVLRLEGVEEYRFQMRPSQAKVKLTDACFRYLNGLFYVNFDALGLIPGEEPAVHDFRVSEVFAAGRQMSWVLREPRSS